MATPVSYYWVVSLLYPVVRDRVVPIASFMIFLRRSLFLVAILCLSGTSAFAQSFGWEVTGYPGTPPLKSPASQVLMDPIGRIMGVEGTGPRIVITTDNGKHWSFIETPFTDVNGLEFRNGKFYISTASSGLHSSATLSNWQGVPLPKNTIDVVSLDGNRGFFEIVTKSDKRMYSMDASNYYLVPDSLGKASESAMAFNGANEILYLSPKGYWRSVAGSNIWTRIGDGMIARGATVVRDSIYFSTFEHPLIPFLVMSKVGGPLDLDTMQLEGGLQFQMMHTIEDTVMIALRMGELHHSFNRLHLSPPLSRSGLNYKDFTITPSGDYISSDVLGIFSSDDYSISWTKLSKRLEANVASELLWLPGNVMYAATNQGYVMRSDDGAQNWVMKSDLFDTITLLAWSAPNTLWIGQKGKLLASHDGGETYLGFEGFSDRTPTCMINDRKGKIYLGTDSGVFHSTDEGSSWFIAPSENMGILTGKKRLPPVLSLSLDSSNQLYVGTEQGVVLSLNEGVKYESGWLSRNPIYALQTAPDGRVYVGSHSVRVDDTLRENFYTGIRPLDPGSVWRTPDESINQWEMNVLNLNSKHQLIAGTLFTWQGGWSWEVNQIPGLENPVFVIAQAIDDKDVVYISSYDKVYRSVIPMVSKVLEQPNDAEFAIYPNPAFDVLKLKSERGGTVRILNMLGEEVLATGVAGTDQISITHLPAGVYFCQLVNDRGTHSLPVVISR